MPKQKCITCNGDKQIIIWKFVKGVQRKVGSRKCPTCKGSGWQGVPKPAAR